MFNVNYFLADEVLKWKTDEESGRWIVSNGLLDKSYWNPMYDLSDAWTVLEVFKEALVGNFMKLKLLDLYYKARGFWKC